MGSDDISVRKALKLRLRSAGYQAQAVADGETAVEFFDEHGADLIILDVKMPGIDGFEVCQAIKQTGDCKILFLTGANDPRVDPMQSRKMTARLQAATSSASAPILLRTSADTGHGGGTALDERIEQYVDVYAFLFHQLGVNSEVVCDPR